MRKHAKRILALTAAATMALSTSLTALAAPSTTKPSDSTVTGGGDISYVDTSTQYEVTLPTGNALDFVLDPQGLTSLKNGESATLEDLLKESTIVNKPNAGAYIKNESSIGVKVTVKMNINDSNSTASDKVNPVDTLEAVTADTKTNICLLAVPSKVASADLTGYQPSTQGIVIKSVDASAPTEFSFVLDKADFTVQKDGSGTLSYAKTAGDDNYDAASFKLAGKANGKANWSAYTGATPKTIGVNAIFSVEDAEDTDKQGTGYDSHGLMELASTVKTVTLAEPAPPEPVAPTITAGATATTEEDAGYDYETTFTKGTALEMTVDFGDDATEITGVMVGNAADNLKANANLATFTGNKVNILATAWDVAASGSIRYVKVTCDDGTELLVKVTIA